MESTPYISFRWYEIQTYWLFDHVRAYYRLLSKFLTQKYPEIFRFSVKKFWKIFEFFKILKVHYELRKNVNTGGWVVFMFHNDASKNFYLSDKFSPNRFCCQLFSRFLLCCYHFRSLSEIEIFSVLKSQNLES